MHRRWHRIIPATLALGLLTALPVHAQDGPIPAKRIQLQADTDMPGGDLGRIFDTTLQACIQACIGDDQCTALTYNQNARACFPKGEGAGGPADFGGALSGRVIAATSEQRMRAEQRATAAPFIAAADLTAAQSQARMFAAMNAALGAGDPIPPPPPQKPAESWCRHATSWPRSLRATMPPATGPTLPA